jgi:hypothetical protein
MHKTWPSCCIGVSQIGYCKNWHLCNNLINWIWIKRLIQTSKDLYPQNKIHIFSKLLQYVTMMMCIV